ncbi:MAG: hypothetical protein AABZ30_15490, partial [Myxococcota bacterium]
AELPLAPASPALSPVGAEAATTESRELAEARRLFELGDFRAARVRLGTLGASGAVSPELRAQADELRARLAADPAVLWVILGCVALFTLITWLTLT